MKPLHIRKIVTLVEDTRLEQGREVTPPRRSALAAAVVTNPQAGRYSQQLAPLPGMGGELGALLGRRALDALGIPGSAVQSYGKGAIVGMAGELEHAAAILHPRLGRSIRALLTHATAIMPSVAKRGPPGSSLDVPMHNVIDAWSFDHFDAVPFAIADAPGPDEILVAVVFAERGRPLARTEPEA